MTTAEQLSRLEQAIEELQSGLTSILKSDNSTKREELSDHNKAEYYDSMYAKLLPLIRYRRTIESALNSATQLIYSNL